MIELGLDPGGKPEQPVGPAFDFAAHRPFGGPDRRPALRLGLGHQQVAQPFGFAQVDSAMEQRAARELAWLGRPESRSGSQRRLYRADHGAAAMEMEFGKVLPRRAAWTGKAEDERAIEQHAVGGLPQRADRGKSRCGHIAGKVAHHLERLRPADAQHRDRGRRRAAGYRVDRIHYFPVLLPASNIARHRPMLASPIGDQLCNICWNASGLPCLSIASTIIET
jgi:hypothetical protein